MLKLMWYLFFLIFLSIPLLLPWMPLLLDYSVQWLNVEVIQRHYTHYTTAYSLLFHATSVLLVLTHFYLQQSKMDISSRQENPIFVSVFFSLLANTLLCSYLQLKHLWFGPKAGYFSTVLLMELLLLGSFLLRKSIAVSGRHSYIAKNSSTGQPCTLLELVGRLTLASVDNPSRAVACLRARYCQRCEHILVTAPRGTLVRHCGICDQCVLGGSHHCLYLMKCVGWSNARHVVCLLLCTIACCVLWVRELVIPFFRTACIASTKTTEGIWCAMQTDAMLCSMLLYHAFALVILLRILGILLADAAPAEGFCCWKLWHIVRFFIFFGRHCRDYVPHLNDNDIV